MSCSGAGLAVGKGGDATFGTGNGVWYAGAGVGGLEMGLLTVYAWTCGLIFVSLGWLKYS
jgi:hypothetical protein